MLKRKYYTGEQIHEAIDGVVGDYKKAIEIYRRLAKMETDDLVPVVRCKDCKWNVVTKLKENYCLRCEDIVKDDYFCADGAKMYVSDNDVGKMDEVEDEHTD
jgi:hypothetical protein